MDTEHFLVSVKKTIFWNWVSEIPEGVFCEVFREVNESLKAQLVATSCPNLYERYVVLRSIAFLVTFTNAGDSFSLISAEPESGEESDTGVVFKRISDDGKVAYVSKETIGSNIAREYQIPEVKQEEVADFPFGYLKTSISEIEENCTGTNPMMGGFSSRIRKPRCSSLNATFSRMNKRCC